MTPPAPTNADRASRAYKTLCFYTSIGQAPPLDEPDEACASDIIADLMHLFGHDEMQTAFDRATRHYIAEREEEDEPPATAA